MTHRHLLIALAVVFSFAACRQTASEELSIEDETTIAEEVQLRVSGYVDAALQGDLDYALDFFADVDGFVMASDGQLAVGYEPWAAFLKSFAESSVNNSFSYYNPHVFVLSHEAVSYATEFEWSMSTAEGDTTKAKGSWIFVFKRFDDVWRVVQSGGTHIYS